MGKPWYANYEELHAQAVEQNQRFSERVQQLGASATQVIDEFKRDIIARSVHESNWQEGIYVDQGRTRELSDAAFDWIDRLVPSTTGPTLDLELLCQEHKSDVLRLKSTGASVEELATFNLSRAHWALNLLGVELARRQTASLASAVSQIKKFLSENPIPGVYGSEAALRVPNKTGIEPRPIKDTDATEAVLLDNLNEALLEGFEALKDLMASDEPLVAPYSEKVRTKGELMQRWLSEAKVEDLRHPMKVEYIHFLHRITMMGVLPASKIGRFRTHAVHVEGNSDLYFPAAATLPSLMEEYCRAFPAVVPFKRDPIVSAAQVSYRFVRVHPYADGNGRVSRLLMNLLLLSRFGFPACIKADNKGRHRYGYALKRADRGNIKPLASLIAMSLRDTYKLLNAALTPFHPLR